MNQQSKQPQNQSRARENAGTGQAKDWEQNQNSGLPDMGNEEDADLNETSVSPSLENRASQDDELENEMTREEHDNDDLDIGDDSDLDYRDGHDRGSEDQDDSDELREGK